MTPPEFPQPLPWLNTDPLRLSHELKGRVILLHFWAHTCIHSLNTLPDLAHLQKKFTGQPFLIISVHVGKYPTDIPSIRAAAERLCITHPILIDENRELWRTLHITSWPTFVLLAPDGSLLGSLSGEGHRPLLETVIQRTLAKSPQPSSQPTTSETRPSGSVRVNAPTETSAPIPNSQSPSPIPHSAFRIPHSLPSPLSFPTKILTDPARRRLILLDSLHHRILLTTWPDADGNSAVQQIIGNGHPALTDGNFAAASFHAPEGATLSAGRTGEILWIADTANHAVRRIDLNKQQVTTVLGTGEREFDNEAGKTGREQPLNSPRDLALFGNRLYISNAGQHQIFAMNLMTALAEVAVGTAREDFRDGPALRAYLAQPSGLALDPQRQILYFTDAENSAVRALDLKTKSVATLIGQGMFEFGDIDGSFQQARLQHPMGLALTHNGSQLLVADTGNNKIKRINLEQEHITALPHGDVQLFEPTSVAAIGDGGEIFVSDTNNHRIMRYAPAANTWTQLTFDGL